MKLNEYIKKNKTFSVFLFLFIVWTGYLLILALTANREIIFYDWVGDTFVNSQYSSEIPILRYILEPIVAITLILDGYDLLIAFIYTAVIYRIVYFHLKKKGYLNSKKTKLLWYPVKDWFRFSFILISIGIIFGLLIVLFLFLFAGFFYVNLYWMAVLQITVLSCLIAIIIKGFILIVKYMHPRLKLNYAKKKRFNLSPARSRFTKYFRSFRREFTYVIGFSMLMCGVGMLLLTVNFPMHRVEADLENDEVLLDFHVHTYMSDGWLSPQQRVDWYLAHGIDGAAFSDHDNLRGAKIASKYVKDQDLDFKVFYSEEWTDHENGIHMNIFGLKETIVPLESEAEGGAPAMNAEDTIAYVKDQGGYIVVNHYNYNFNPNGGFGTPYNLTTLMEWGVDGFEIVNGGHPKHYKIREFCFNNSLICIGGSDIHSNKELNTFIKLKLANPDEFTIDDVFTELQKNEHQVVGINLNPKDFRLPELMYALELDYVEDFIEYLLNLNSFQLLSWIVWSSGGFLLIAYLYFHIKNSELKKFKQKIL